MGNSTERNIKSTIQIPKELKNTGIKERRPWLKLLPDIRDFKCIVGESTTVITGYKKVLKRTLYFKPYLYKAANRYATHMLMELERQSKEGDLRRY